MAKQINEIPSSDPEQPVMTLAEAEQRIILSRHTLKRFRQLSGAGQKVKVQEIPLIQNEIVLLEGLAKEHAELVSKVIVLVCDWMTFRDDIRTTVH